MKLLTPLLISVGMLLSPPAALTQKPVADGKSEQAVQTAMGQFAKAVLAADKATLERLVGDSVLYSHSNGNLDTKAQFIGSVMSEKPKYEGFEYGDTKILIYGSTAVVRGRIMVKTLQDGKRTTIDLNAMQIWMKGSEGWTMVARQSTRMNP